MGDHAQRLAGHPKWHWVASMMLTDGAAVAWRLLQGFPGEDVWIAARNDSAPPGWSTCCLSFGLNRSNMLPVLSNVGTVGALRNMLWSVAETMNILHDQLDGVCITLSLPSGSCGTFEGAHLGETIADALLWAWDVQP